MASITSAEAYLIDLAVETPRTDAVQAFLKQETIFVELETDEGLRGTGYSYTIGTGGTAVLAMLRDYLLPKVIGQDARRVEQIWNDVYYSTRATTTGALTSLAVAAIDTALWDLRCLRASEPLWITAGGFRDAVPVYDTEGGWLHIDTDELVRGAQDSRRRGLAGLKIKVGKTHLAEDVERLTAVRAAIGDRMHLMVDANQSMTLAEARRRADAFRDVDLYWLEEPLPADDVSAHAELVRGTAVPIAVGESLYSTSQFREYFQQRAATICQVDAARVGGITPWLKTAHLAAAFDIPVCPHFLMELHVSLTAAVPNGAFIEYIPQLRAITRSELVVEDGWARVPISTGLGIDWDRDAIDDLRVA